MQQNIFKNIYASLSKRTNLVIERAKLTEHTFMIIVAIIIGILAGFAAIGIRFLIEEISSISFAGDGNLLENIIASPWYIIVLAPIIGGLIVGPLIYFFAPEAKGHGVPEVMQAILLRGGNIRPRVAIVKALASAITIGTGGSVGREGPIIQIGSSLGSTVGQFFRIPSKRLKTLVGCGAAAGIAAAFNAPIAGALFAVEIILMDFAVAQFSPIVISSVMATVISHSFEGNFAAFRVPAYELVSPYEISFYFLLGALAGIVSYLFIKVLYFSEEFFDEKLKFPEYLRPIIGGLGIGLIALVFPQVMGVGYDSINLALHGDMLWYLAFGLIFLKIFATSLTLGSGGSGGIFAPSLFMGAMVGAFFGYVVNIVFPEITAGPGAYALVAMGGMVAGTTRAPITAIIIVFELTKEYEIILPLMITCIISMIISSRLSRESIYTLKLLLRNISIKEGAEINVMESIYTKEVYTDDYTAINLRDNFSQVVNEMVGGRGSVFPVVNDSGRISGVITTNSIKDYLFERDSLSSLLIANDILITEFETVTPDDNCQAALDKMRKYDFDGIPVVDARSPKVLLGMIWLKDIQHAYQREIERRDITSSLASSISMKEDEQHVHFIEGYSIAEIKPPASFTNKSIKELNIRAKFGVDVLSVKTKEKRGEKIKAIPSPDYIITENDTLVVAGEIRSINLLKHID
ncbi:MAG: CBS domain-containing protein [Ignavibacteriae bacterium]|nr:CBS domain-containing protein [Ignavibacteriota bacterium]NOG98113.1 CBS domain-containing protein [Ignavibacteriota bacterium]